MANVKCAPNAHKRHRTKTHNITNGQNMVKSPTTRLKKKKKTYK